MRPIASGRCDWAEPGVREGVELDEEALCGDGIQLALNARWPEHRRARSVDGGGTRRDTGLEAGVERGQEIAVGLLQCPVFGTCPRIRRSAGDEVHRWRRMAAEPLVDEEERLEMVAAFRNEGSDRLDLLLRTHPCGEARQD